MSDDSRLAFQTQHSCPSRLFNISYQLACLLIVVLAHLALLRDDVAHQGQALHSTGAFLEPHGPGIPVHTLHGTVGIVLEVTDAAKNLQTAVGNDTDGVDSLQLEHGGDHFNVLPIINLLGTLVGQQAQGVDTCGHVGNGLLDGLALDDFLAKCDPVIGTGNGHLQEALAHAQQAYANGGAGDRQRVEELVQALAHGADTVAVGYDHVLHAQMRVAGTAAAHHMGHGVNDQARCVSGDKEGRQAVLAVLVIRNGDGEEAVSNIGEGDQGLGAVQNPVVTVFDRGGLDIGAGAAVGLSQGKRAKIVAFTKLCGLEEPLDFANTSVIPTLSSTARIAPPATTPVP